MIARTTPDDWHLDDHELIAWLDGECGEAEMTRIRTHLVQCPQCRRSAETLAELSQQFSEALFALDELAVLKAYRHRPSLWRRLWVRLRSAGPKSRIAAVIAGVVLLIVAAPPLRAWLVAGWNAVFGRESSVAQQQLPASVVSFTPTGDEFLIEYAGWQAAGVLVVVPDSAVTVRAHVRGAPEEMVVLPSGIRILNAAESRASYEVRVPASLRLVRIRVGDAMLRELRSAELSGKARWEFRLSQGIQGQP